MDQHQHHNSPHQWTPPYPHHIHNPLQNPTKETPPRLKKTEHNLRIPLQKQNKRPKTHRTDAIRRLLALVDFIAHSRPPSLLPLLQVAFPSCPRTTTPLPSAGSTAHADDRAAIANSNSQRASAVLHNYMLTSKTPNPEQAHHAQSLVAQAGCGAAGDESEGLGDGSAGFERWAGVVKSGRGKRRNGGRSGALASRRDAANAAPGCERSAAPEGGWVVGNCSLPLSLDKPAFLDSAHSAPRVHCVVRRSTVGCGFCGDSALLSMSSASSTSSIPSGHSLHCTVHCSATCELRYSFLLVWFTFHFMQISSMLHWIVGLTRFILFSTYSDVRFNPFTTTPKWAQSTLFFENL